MAGARPWAPDRFLQTRPPKHTDSRGHVGVRRRVLEADLNIGPAHRRNVGCARSPSRETDTLRGVSDKPCAMLAASVTVPG